MRHITEDALLAYLDGELESDRRARVAEHVLACDECRHELEELRRRSSLLSDVLPSVEAAGAGDALSELRARTGEHRGRDRDTDGPRQADADVVGGSPSTPAGSSDGGSRRSIRAFLQAAALVLAFAGAAAAAIPGSPVRTWLVRSVDAVTELFTADAEEAERPDATGEALSAVAVKPEKGKISIQLTEPAAGLRVRVELVDSDRARVRAGKSRYRTGPGRIEVLEPWGEDVYIELPSRAREARVEVDGRGVVRLEGGRLLAEVDAERATPSTVVFRVPSARP